MFKLARAVLLFAVLALTLAEPRVQQLPAAEHRSVGGNAASASSNHPYLFLSVPRGRASVGGNSLQGFQVVEEEDEDDESQLDDDDELERNASSVDYNDDEDSQDDDEYEDSNVSDDDVEENFVDSNNVAHINVRDRVSTINRPNLQSIMKNAKSTHMMVSREQAGAIMVPDGVIEIEGQSVVDEKTGKAALLVPRAALDAIPDGSVVALMERSASESEEERANRVLVRRRRKGSRRNVRRRRGGRRRRRGGNRRRRVNKRRNVRVYTVGGNRRRGTRRGSRPTIIQG